MLEEVKTLILCVLCDLPLTINISHLKGEDLNAAEDCLPLF